MKKLILILIFGPLFTCTMAQVTVDAIIAVVGKEIILQSDLDKAVTERTTMNRDIDDMDALSLAMEAGSPKAVNIVLMGRVSRYFPEISEEAWLASLEACVPPKFLEMNKKAFMLGRN